MNSEYVVVSYKTASGKQPFDEWLNKLRKKNRVAAVAVDSRIARIRDRGNFGDSRFLGHGAYELRIHLGPGYRVYYALHEQTIVVLLAGGEKVDQQHDIEKAYEYASDFKRRL